MSGNKPRRLPLADVLAGVAGLAIGLFLGAWKGGAFEPSFEPSSVRLDAPGMEEAARAHELAREDRLEEAVRVLKDGQGCRAALLLTRARLALPLDPEGALEPLGEFLTLYPRSWRRWEATLLTARALSALGKPGDARGVLKTTLMFEPKRLERAERSIGLRGAWPGCTHAAWLALARLYLEEGAYSEAKEASELVPETSRGEVFLWSPERPAALLLWARAMAAQGTEETARAGLLELVEIFPDSPQAAEARELLER